MKLKKFINKNKAFTLLELMVIMSVMTILVAAMSPMFTGKEKYSGDVVWHFAGGDTSGSAFSSPYNTFLRSAFYIGILPTKEQIDNVVNLSTRPDEYNSRLRNAKLTIRAGQLNKNQRMIDFRLTTKDANKEDGILVASLLNNGTNFLLGGPYESFELGTRPYDTSDTYGNTAFGASALKSAKKHHLRSTAIGYNTLNYENNNAKDYDNTIIGVMMDKKSGSNIESYTFNKYKDDEYFEVGDHNYDWKWKDTSDDTGKNTFIGIFDQPFSSEYREKGYASNNTIIGNRRAVVTNEEKNKDNSPQPSRNTLVGANVAPHLTGHGNVIVGSNAGNSLTTGHFNTIVGGGILTSRGGTGEWPSENGVNIRDANDNAAGQYITSGSGNTIVGVNAGNAFAYKKGIGSNVTCIGYGSCPFLDSDQVVYDMGEGVYATDKKKYRHQMGFFTENPGKNAGEHVFIGGPPKTFEVYAQGSSGGKKKLSRDGFAVLEIHNVNRKNAIARTLTEDITDTSPEAFPLNPEGREKINQAIKDYKVKGTEFKMGDESVLINGNLIVRGQTFMGGVRSGLTSTYSKSDFPLYGMYYDTTAAQDDNSVRAFMAYDGQAPNTNYTQGKNDVHNGTAFSNDDEWHKHCDKDNEYYQAHPDEQYADVYCYKQVLNPKTRILNGHLHCTCAPTKDSYDWTTMMDYNNPHCNISTKIRLTLYYAYFRNARGVTDREHVYSMINILSGDNHCNYEDKHMGYNDVYYYDSEGPKKFSFNQAHTSMSADNPFVINNKEVDGGCCPDLRFHKSSDSRLKNIGKPFTSGLAEIKKLKIFNFTFKADRNKTPHVGVIAQELKQVFKNAVSKDSAGYYQIRWDEMFYAAINAVKEINTKVETLSARVAKDIERVKTLKQENAQLAQKLEQLSKELDELEKKK